MRILAVGTATLDVICAVPVYPEEDQELRAESLRFVRGGNATNSLVVLQALGHQGAWAGALAGDSDSRYITDDLTQHQIDLSWVQRHPGGKSPTSLVWVSALNGSRTIVHYRDLPEYPFHAFQAIDLQAFDWIHFEGRNVAELKNMLMHVKDSGGPPCSLEIEKPRAGIEELLALPDLLLIGKDYAQARGFDSAQGLLNALHGQGIHTPLFCAWGAQGAWAMDADGTLHHQPAWVPETLVDSLGAGDVFNAGVIHVWLNGLPIARALEFAVLLAGKKCGQQGFQGVLADGPDLQLRFAATTD